MSGLRSMIPPFLPFLSLTFIPFLYSHSFCLSFCLFLSVYLYCSIFTISYTLQFYSSLNLTSFPFYCCLTLPYPPPLLFPFFFCIFSLPPLFFPSLRTGRTHNLCYDLALAHRGYRNRSVIRYVRARTLFSFIIYHFLIIFSSMLRPSLNMIRIPFTSFLSVPSLLTYQLILSCTQSLSLSLVHSIPYCTVLCWD